MSDFVNRIDSLLDKKGIKRSDLYNSIESINSHSFYDWTRRNSIPSADIACKIADFLGTTVEYLVTGQDNAPKADTSRLLELLESATEEARRISGE